MKTLFTTVAISIGLIAASNTKADWTADFVATSSTGEFSQVSGKIFSKIDRFRIDSSTPFEMSLYAKSDSNRVYAAVHSFKIRLSTNTEKFSGQMPACLSKDFALCVKNLKLKKLSSEKCADRICDVYEGAPNMKGMKKIKLWHWAGEKEPIFSQSILTKKNGSEIKTVFSNITRKSYADSQFTIPANYKDAGSLESFIGDLKGFSP